ncbi:MAG: ABC transporter ATP-binding protein [Acidimicrobiales bacterium]
MFRGQPLAVDSPSASIAAGIGMIHQHFMLVPTLTVVENIALGLSTKRFSRLDLGPVRERVLELSSIYGLHVDPDAKIWQLAVGERQRVEILKALYRDADLLVLDEPTAVLTPTEVDELFVTLRQMRDDGKALIFISHKLHEVLALSDRITVLRDGRISGTADPTTATREHLAELMVGRAVKLAPEKPPVALGDVRLELRGLTCQGDRGVEALKQVDLSVRGGEILGIAGVSGNGQRELAEVVAGLRPATHGIVEIDNTPINGKSPRQRRDVGLAYVPEERMRDGAIGSFSVAENLVLIDHDKAAFCDRGFLKLGAINSHAEQIVRDYAVKTPTITTSTKSLSGGNIQKIIMGRELHGNPAVLIASQPTRGVDIGAAENIHERLVAQRAAGTAIVVISEDLDEVIGLSDRVAVMLEGRIVGIVDAADATVEKLGLLMGGAELSEA